MCLKNRFFNEENIERKKEEELLKKLNSGLISFGFALFFLIYFKFIDKKTNYKKNLT